MVQIINGGNIVATYPLNTALDKVSLANALYVNVQWSPGDARYVGKNTAKFVIKLGAKEYSSAGDFTLTP